MRILALTALTAAAITHTSSARAEFYVGFGGALSGGIGDLHFGELIGQPEDGRDDLSGRRAGAYVRGGVVRGPFELGPRLGFAFGGLSMSRIEEVYSSADPEAFGAASVFDAAVELRFEQDVGAGWIPYGGAAVGWERMTAASASTTAWVDAVFGEVSAGLSFSLGPRPLSRGRIDAGVVLRVSGAYSAYFNGEITTAEDVRFFGSPGIAVSYTYRL
jgi:hypothetical protein